MNKKEDFNDFRFSGLNWRMCSNRYATMNRIDENEEKIVIKIGDSHLLPTKYGYAFILDHTHVVFLKNWQVDQNWYGNEIILTRQYFDVKEWGTHDNFFEADDKSKLTFDYYLEIAKEQEDLVNADGVHINPVRWQIYE